MASPTVSRASDDDVARFHCVQFPRGWAARAIKRRGLVQALGGVYEDDDGRWYAFLDIPYRLKRATLYRHARRVLQEAADMGAETVYSVCDDAIPRSREFMDRLGFVPTDETTHDGKVIWSWQPFPQ